MLDVKSKSNIYPIHICKA